MRKLAITLSQFLLYSGLFTYLALFLSSVLSCLFSIDCSHGLPTISYVAKFQIHREIFVLLMAFFSYTYLCIYLPLNTLLQDIPGCCSSCVSLVGLVSIPLIICVALINQGINQTVHLALALGYLALQLFYIFSLRWVLLRRHLLFRSHFEYPLSTMRKWDIWICVSSSILLVQVVIANTHGHNFFHTSIQSIAEHVLAAVGIMQPYVFARLFPAHMLIIGKEGYIKN